MDYPRWIDPDGLILNIAPSGIVDEDLPHGDVLKELSL